MMTNATTATTQWWWATAADEQSPQPGSETFATREDAEAWLGQTWEDLLDDGVEEVFLWHGTDRIFGPMPLGE